MASSASIRVLAFRPSVRAIVPAKRAAFVARRTYADERAVNQHSVLPEAPKGEEGQTRHKQQEHVSEEAAKMAKIQGGSGPDIEGQGTPVQEILKEEKDMQKNAPQVMKDAIKKDGGAQQAFNSKPSTNARSFSTYARRRLEVTPGGSDMSANFDPAMLSTTNPLTTTDSSLITPPEPTKGHKFPLPDLPLMPGSHKNKRYETVVEQLTNLMMVHGKKATAQRNLSVILSHLRTSSPPTLSPKHPLIPGHPPPSHLPLHPILYLTLAVDSVAPLLRIRSQRGAAGGGAALQIPIPLSQRQRRRIAFNWIIDAASKKRSRGSGRDMFALRVAEEIVGVVEGRSAVWERRANIHRMGTTARVNLNFGKRGRR